MKKKLLSAVMVCALGFVGCGDDEEEGPPPPPATKFNTADSIRTYLDGKSMLMEGENIPSHPNGYSEDVNYGSASQCYQKVMMTNSGGNFTVNSTLATIRDTGCDHNAVSGNQSFTSTGVLIENVKEDASCFDITLTYVGFKQVGRGVLSQDGKTLTLELYFEGQASGATCTTGAVGASTVTLNKAPFTGNAKQVYMVSAGQ
ncbi:hypothetical protein [Stigmatella aurantiaca]|uniref:Lipoprotein n=1 Tax=Stigmatella aurantiaca (strain DW4/3-1) TaxID=378806 RepID=Q098G5_STIAD|nr:hypothetical protein [Stigmatella aurantiaca]ADO68090.1 putative lipoprotein [Stigmatella aurantiaca DW4/3-1]EAU68126.1 hypothetical protein STIAU_2719 [Stigmatella aurantiaca DW4/3-1]